MCQALLEVLLVNALIFTFTTTAETGIIIPILQMKKLGQSIEILSNLPYKW